MAEVSVPDQLIEIVDERRQRIGEMYVKIIQRANQCDFPDQRERMFQSADFYKELENEFLSLLSKMREVTREAHADEKP